MSFDVVLQKKEFVAGLNKDEIINLFGQLDGVEAYPIELEAREQECSAMGFITPKAAKVLCFDYETSGLHDFIAVILDSSDEVSGSYEFEGLRIKIV